MPSRPAKGALTIFSSMRARCAITSARAVLRVETSVSITAWLTAWAANCSWSRFKVCAASSAAACSCSSLAKSSLGLSLSRTLPAGTSLPESNSIESTTPEACAERSAPRTARSEPMACTCACHGVLAAVTVETVCGAAAACSMNFLKNDPATACHANTPPMTRATSSTTTIRATAIRRGPGARPPSTTELFIIRRFLALLRPVCSCRRDSTSRRRAPGTMRRCRGNAARAP